MREVELHHAWCWTCDDCGRDNFVRAVCLSAETVAAQVDNDPEVMEFLGTNGIEDCYTYPGTVWCEHCNAEYETEVE